MSDVPLSSSSHKCVSDGCSDRVTDPIDVVITTNKDPASCRLTIQSICAQRGCTDLRLLIVCDRVFETRGDEDERRAAIVGYCETLPYQIVSQFHDDLLAGRGGASGARNRALAYMRDDAFIVRLDDDVVCPPSTIRETIVFVCWYHAVYHTMCMIAPVLYYRNTNTIQMIGFSGFSYWMGWPLPIHVLDWRARLRKGVDRATPITRDEYSRYRLSSVGASFMAGHVSLFRDAPYDERIPYIYEDLDMSTRAVMQGADLVVPTHISVNHMERNKTHLEQSFIGSPSLARYKAKHRRRFAWSHGTWRQRFVYCMIGVHFHTLWLLIKLIRYRQFHLLVPFLVGHRQGLISVIRDPSRSPVVTSSTSAIGDIKISVTN